MICRIWDKENNRFWEDVNEGYNGKIEQLMVSTSGELIMRTIDKMIHESLFPGRFTISWGTGIRDRNNQEIYAGDVLHVEYMLVENVAPFNCLVEWDKFRFAMRNLDFDKNSAYPSFTPLYNLDPFGMNIEVIGNIYQNKELIS